MTKEEVIEKIQYATMQVASVYACSALFDERTKEIKGRQEELKKKKKSNCQFAGCT